LQQKGACEMNSQAELLVTDDELIAKLHELLGSRFSNHGQLMIPSFQQYEALSSDNGLDVLAKDMCRWLGFKPRKLTVTYGKISETYYSVDSEAIIINETFREHPLVTGGILASAVLSFVLSHHHYTPNSRFIEVTTIEAGLGLWIINALRPRLSHREKLYHMIDGNWEQLEGLQLQSMNNGDYVRLFSIYTSTNRLFPEDYGGGVTKRSLHLLPPTPSATKIVPLVEPTAVITHVQNANKLWIKICLLSASAAAVVVFGLLIWGHRPTPVSSQQTNDSESLRVIKQSLAECIKHASEQQSTYDPNDLFLTRQIDATKTRCESLRNQYNDALSLYEGNYVKSN
jgi:hypothetical protein